MSLLARAKRMLWLFGKFKVRMIGFCKPKLIAIDDKTLVVRIPLNGKTKNHLNSMYFGALSVGADVAGGLHAFFHAEQSKKKASIVFKSFKAQFEKRPESDVTFVSEDGLIVKQAIEDAIQTKERVNQMVHIKAFIHYPDKPEQVASFELELSVKIKE